MRKILICQILVEEWTVRDREKKSDNQEEGSGEAVKGKGLDSGQYALGSTDNYIEAGGQGEEEWGPDGKPKLQRRYKLNNGTIIRQDQ